MGDLEPSRVVLAVDPNFVYFDQAWSPAFAKFWPSCNLVKKTDYLEALGYLNSPNNPRPYLVFGYLSTRDLGLLLKYDQPSAEEQSNGEVKWYKLPLGLLKKIANATLQSLRKLNTHRKPEEPSNEEKNINALRQIALLYLTEGCLFFNVSSLEAYMPRSLEEIRCLFPGTIILNNPGQLEELLKSQTTAPNP